MTIKLGIVMDPIAAINYKKDSTLAMLWAAQERNWEIYYFELKDLFSLNEHVYGNGKQLEVFRDPKRWFNFKNASRILLSDLDVILMRKDPPFDQEYIYATYLLEEAERNNVLVVNKPQSLRDANEKMFVRLFPQCCPPTLITRDMDLLHEFLREEKDIVCKPLDSMGGESVFRVTHPDLNASVIFELLTKRGKIFTMAQKYIPDILEKGDKRILMINGEPVPYALARIPKAGELRGNLAAGAKGVAQPLTEKDRWICQQLAPTLKEKGLFFVGLDVIGDYLTEINVTSPTCIRELDEQCNLNIAGQLLAEIDKII